MATYTSNSVPEKCDKNTTKLNNEGDDELEKYVVDMFDEIPKNYDFRLDRKVNENIKKILNIGKKNDTSFLFIRKSFMNFLLQNKLIVDEKIILNTDLCVMLNLKKIKGNININNIDKLVYRLINID